MLGHSSTFSPSGAGLFVLRTDPLGNLVWINSYGLSLSRSYSEKAQIRSLINGGYIISGTVNSPSEGGQLGVLIRIDDAGALQWMKFYNQVGLSFDFTQFNDVQQTSTGFIVTGRSATTVAVGQNSTDTFVMSLDAAGTPIWTMQYPQPLGDDAGQSILQTPTGYVVSGDQFIGGVSGAILFTTDPLGNLVWYKQVEPFMHAGVASGSLAPNGTLHIMSNGDYAFHGGGLDDNAQILRFDPAGTFVSGRSYGQLGFHFATSSILEPGNNEITFVGPTNTTWLNDYYMVRTDAALSSDCNDTPVSPPVTTPMMMTTPLSYATQSIMSTSPLLPTVTDLFWSEEVICASSPCIEAVPITCTVSGGLTVTVTWPPLPASVATAEIWRDGIFQGVVAGTSYSDTPPVGAHTYELRLYDVMPQCPYASSFCNVTTGLVIGTVTDVLIWPWRPAPDNPVVCWGDDLVNRGRNPVIGSSIADLVSPQLGSGVPGTTPVVWLSLGQFPYDHRLTPAEGQILANYLSAGGSLYIEGADVAFTNFTALAQLDGVVAVDNGAVDGSVTALTGLDSGLGLNATLLSSSYSGSGRSIDHLAPDGPGAGAIFRNGGPPGQTTGVYYDASVAGAGNHRVVTSSSLIEGYDGDRSALLDTLLDALSPAAGPEFIRGDGNGDGSVDIGDPVYNLGYLFNSGPSVCLKTQDVNDDGSVDIGDPVYNLTYQFASGPAPASPFPTCGSDPTDDTLDCQSYSCP